MGLGVAHDQDSDGGQGAYARDHEPVTPTEFEDEYSEDGLEHWNDEIAEIEAQQEELEKRARGVSHRWHASQLDTVVFTGMTYKGWTLKCEKCSVASLRRRLM